ncbi:hypothetical protein PIROE2DRAFT_63005 [Piromyces sp. E2]|nr:hypothetical protein PIROE2DRAFT_63005 [Piromyces sp. E2]|eukprot:OUM60688.1 hypothetical protein PIROE2DRAFT_63005 [Piromyces sp. E2]
MQSIITKNDNSSQIIGHDELQSLNTRRVTDALQVTINVYINSHLFPWICLLLILNRRDWKRPVIIILLLYWFLQSSGDLLQSYLNYFDVEEYKRQNLFWPFNNTNWYVINSVAFLVWVSGEIIADWYPLLRTKAILNNKKNIKPIYTVCIVYNLVKVLHILSNFIFKPETFVIKKGKQSNEYLLMNKIIWWSLVVLVQVVSFCYDVLVMITLKNSLFDKIKRLKSGSNSFLEKFKQISEFRIFISLIISIIFLPFAVFQVYLYIGWYSDVKNTKAGSERNWGNITDQVEYIRILILRFTYSSMYIDQILLRFYVSKNKKHYLPGSPLDSRLLIAPPTPCTPSPTLYTPSPTESIYNSNKFRVSYHCKSNYIGNDHDNDEQDIPRVTNNPSSVLLSKQKIKSSYYLQNLGKLSNTHKWKNLYD